MLSPMDEGPARKPRALGNTGLSGLNPSLVTPLKIAPPTLGGPLIDPMPANTPKLAPAPAIGDPATPPMTLSQPGVPPGPSDATPWGMSMPGTLSLPPGGTAGMTATPSAVTPIGSELVNGWAGMNGPGLTMPAAGGSEPALPTYGTPLGTVNATGMQNPDLDPFNQPGTGMQVVPPRLPDAGAIAPPSDALPPSAAPQSGTMVPLSEPVAAAPTPPARPSIAPTDIPPISDGFGFSPPPSNPLAIPQATDIPSTPTGGSAPPTLPGTVSDPFTGAQNLLREQIDPSFTPQYDDRAAREIEAARVKDEGPLAGTDVAEVNRLLGGAEGAVNGSTLNTGNFTASGDADRARQMLMDSLGSVMGGPDRGKLAADALALEQERTNPLYEQELRRVGQRASALGRVGAGMTTNDLTDVFSQRQRDLDILKRSLANDAAGQTMADNLSRFGAVSGAAGQLRGEDLAGSNFNFGVDQARAANGLGRASALGSIANQRFGVAQAGRADAESDRAYRTALGSTNAGLALNRASAFQGLDANRFSREAAQRDELRGERSYQAGQNQQAFNNTNTRAQVEDALTNSAAGRDSDLMRILLGAMGDPNALTNTLLNSSTQQGANAGQGSSDAMNLLMQYFASQRANGGAPTTGNAPFPTSWAY